MLKRSRKRLAERTSGHADPAKNQLTYGLVERKPGDVTDDLCSYQVPAA